MRPQGSPESSLAQHLREVAIDDGNGVFEEFNDINDMMCCIGGKPVKTVRQLVESDRTVFD
jgi:hypothetical protein